MDERTKNLVAECRRQHDSCLYTSTTIFGWLKSLRRWRIFFVIAPIILGTIATAPMLAELDGFQWVTGVCGLLAGLFPAVYKALDLDVSLGMLADRAQQYKKLQDRFRQAADVTALGPFDEFKADFDKLMDAMDIARDNGLTPPEKFFKEAQAKIQSGDYDFDVDQKPKP